MSLAAIIARQIAKAGTDLVDYSTVEKTVKAKVAPLVQKHGISGKDKEEYVARMTKALANGDTSFKTDPSIDPDEVLLFDFDDVVTSTKASTKVVSEDDVTRSVMPAPQRFFDPEDKDFKPFLGDMGEQAGGRYLEMGGGPPRDITGEYPAQAVIGVTPEGKPIMKVSEALLDGEVRTDGRKIKTNLFKKKAGWKWTKVPEGFDPDPPSNFPLVSVEDGKQHYYALRTEFPEGVELSRYERSKTEPRLRPTKKGNVHLGEKVGEITVRGKKHPVYDQIKVYGLLGASTTIMSEDREEFSDGGIVGFFKDLMASDPKESGRVTVNKGDTLAKIARETGVSVKELQEYNNIEDVNKIEAGTSLRVKPPVEKNQVVSNLGSFLNPFAGDKTEADYDTAVVEELRKAARRAVASGRMNIVYEDYKGNVRAQASSPEQREKDSFIRRMITGDISSTEEAAFSVGGATLVEEDGNLYATDVYDFSEIPSEKITDVYSAARYIAGKFPGREFKSKIYLGPMREFKYEGGITRRVAKAKGGRVDKDKMACNKPKRTPNHPKKSHVVKACEGGKEKVIRFGEQGAKTAGKPKAGESKRMKAKRKSFKARHRKNIKKGKMSAAYWADKTKW